jgi:preprotein translocase subunit YajC
VRTGKEILVVAEQITGLLPLILIIAVGYLLIIRPARKRQRQLLSVQQQLAPGVRVMTTSGLYATVREVTDARIVLETSAGVHSTWARNAIGRIEPGTQDSPVPNQMVDLTDATRTAATTDAGTTHAGTTDGGTVAGSELGAHGRPTDRPDS